MAPESSDWAQRPVLGTWTLGVVIPQRPCAEQDCWVDTQQDSGLASARRIAIVGCIGAGKSTLARELGALLHLEVFHSDQMWWQGGGYRIVGKKTAESHAMDPQAFRRLQEGLVSQDQWIIDGGRADLSVRIPRADTVIFLDLPRRTCMSRVVRRTGSPRSDYPSHVLESWRWMVVLLRWVWSYPRRSVPAWSPRSRSLGETPTCCGVARFRMYVSLC